jgi:hypothetical protein
MSCPSLQDGHDVVAVHPLVPRRVHLDAVVEAEEPRGPIAMPEKGVERRQHRRPPRRPAAAPRRLQSRQVAGKRIPRRFAGLAPRRILHRDTHHFAGGEHLSEHAPSLRHARARNVRYMRRSRAGRGAQLA